ncbi:hypothetical protein [Avibacterium paragallinarum]|uniref:hypothetical protein n=1 Tax=Avibacterium paragallinarum TaxID=728 RepID=UPI001890A5B7|nr:hypothetical protein [Avibacterium paragallinarum]
MWKKQQLQLPPQTKTALQNVQKGITSPFSLSVQGTKLGVHNWTHGIREDSGRYLSPENAVKVIQAKFTDYSDPHRPKGEVQCVAIMITAAKIADFITALENAAVLLPYPEFKQALDYAKSQQTLSDSKMIKMPTIGNPSFLPSADITPQSARTLQAVMRNANATASQNLDPMAMLAELKAKKAEREQKNQEKTTALLNASVEAYCYTKKAHLEQIALEINQHIPNASNIFTALLVFIGEDLTNLKEMMR